MKKCIALLIFTAFTQIFSIKAQTPFEVNGLCIKAPAKENIDRFIDFVEKELVPKGINTLVLRVDYNYAYTSRPELQGSDPLELTDGKKLVAISKKSRFQLIPQFL
ncbi:MAG: hypothetical protein HKN31_00340 [Pricia sp.]|nr:hypothetical protein [Pricia sp.]